MKTTTIFYYNLEGDDAKAKVLAERKEMRAGYSRDATTFDGVAEPCTHVIVMGSVTGHHRAKIVAAYGDRVEKDPREVEAQALATARESERNPGAVAQESVRETGRRGRTVSAVPDDSQHR